MFRSTWRPPAIAWRASGPGADGHKTRSRTLGLGSERPYDCDHMNYVASGAWLPDNERSLPMHRALLLTSALVIAGSIAVAAAQTRSPYAGQEQRTIKALSDDEIRDLLEARGMGRAKAAELNSCPGPSHVLQLTKELALSDAQRTATEALYAEMRAKAQPIGRHIIEAESDLDRAFVSGQIDLPSMRDRTRVIAILQGELRAVHLDAHLRQRELLTPEQIARYDALRGYGGDRPAHTGARHGG